MKQGKTELEKATNRTRHGSRTTPTHDGGADRRQQGVFHTVQKARRQEGPEREVADEKPEKRGHWLPLLLFKGLGRSSKPACR